MSEHFEADWLTLRESADAAARATALVERARAWLTRRPSPLSITDLGAGSGANPRYLSRRLPGPQRWRLVDHDPALLARAGESIAGVQDADGTPVRFETCQKDLADIESALEDNTDLATASALFDLVSADWIDALAARCAEIGCAALWTLSVDGQWHFTGPDGQPIETSGDTEMRSLLQAHQAREKGLGQALGGAAPRTLREAFARRGYAIFEATSPWRLDAGAQHALALALLDGWRAALAQQAPGEQQSIDSWWRERRHAIEVGELGIEVGHIDIYAEPPA